jgi:type I restriction enzyme S subunit
VTYQRIKHIASVAVSNVDKKASDAEVPVRLCNYTDVYYNDRITAELPMMEATATYDQIARFGLRWNDVLVTKDSETPDDIAVPSYVAENLPDVVCGYHLALLRPKPETDGRFLFWALASSWSREQFAASANGITRFGLRYDTFGEVRVPFPPLQQQRAIADYLDRETARIDALIDRKRRMVELFRERRQTLITDTVIGGAPLLERRRSSAAGRGDAVIDHPTVPIRRLAQGGGLFTDGDWIESPFIAEEGIRLIQTGNVGVGLYKEQGFRFISEETFHALNCTEVFPDDLLICRLAEPVGRSCIAPSLGTRMITSVDVAILRPRPGSADVRYLNYYFSSSSHLEFIDSIARGGTRQRISRDQLGSAPVPLPPLQQQHAIADQLDRETAHIDTLIGQINNQMALLAERRQALITAAVMGELAIPGVAA